MNTTTQQDFALELFVNASAEETMEKISQVNLWWAKKFSGSASKLHDEFKVDFGQTFVNLKVTELVPGKKIVWYVTDCYLHWINDKHEWTGTEITWTLSQKGDQTQVNFVHKGVNPESECYETCNPGWRHHLKDSFEKLVNGGTGMPV